MTHSSPIHAILFDLGGTLFEPLEAGFHLHNLKAALHASGIAMEPDAEARFTSVRIDVETELRATPFYLHRELVARTLSAFVLSLGAQPSPQTIRGYCNQQRQSVTEHLALRRDCISSLSTLQAAGLRMAIVSNIDDDYLIPLLQRTRIDRFLEFALSSEKAMSCKPDPRIFQQAIMRVGADPHQILFVGDSETNDVQGAQALGMRTALLAAPGPKSTCADFLLNELSELTGLLGKRSLGPPGHGALPDIH